MFHTSHRPQVRDMMEDDFGNMYQQSSIQQQQQQHYPKVVDYLHQHQPQLQQQQHYEEAATSNLLPPPPPQARHPRKRKLNASSSSSSTSNGSNVCRDFLRNVCDRGSRCKFSHPSPTAADSTAPSNPEDTEEWDQCPLQDTFVFCHDFQNRQQGCNRPQCRFLHCTGEEEDEYHASGYLPPSVRDQALRKGLAADLPAHFGTRPICKDFLKGGCRRANCKFRHVTAKQYDQEMNQMMSNGGGAGSSGSGGGEGGSRHNGQQQKAGGGEEGSESDYVQMLRHENMFLGQRLEELKKQVHDLSTTNDFLLEQNAQLRLGVKAAAAAAAVAAVSTSLSQHHHQHPQQAAPTANVVSMSLQQLQPTVSMSVVQPPQSLVPIIQPIRMSAVATIPQQPTAATITMATLDTSLTPAATVSLPVVQPVSAAAVMSCCHGAQEITAHVQPATSANAALHLQETRLVTFPITSIHQAM